MPGSIVPFWYCEYWDCGCQPGIFTPLHLPKALDVCCCLPWTFGFGHIYCRCVYLHFFFPFKTYSQGSQELKLTTLPVMTRTSFIKVPSCCLPSWAELRSMAALYSKTGPQSIPCNSNWMHWGLEGQSSIRADRSAYCFYGTCPHRLINPRSALAKHAGIPEITILIQH